MSGTQELEDKDTIILPKDIDLVMHRCCGCGLWHRIEIDRKSNGDTFLKFKQLDGEPEVKSQRILKVIKGE